jgi:hypothetical protein
MAAPKVLEYKKLESGNFAVRWSNSPKKWAIIKNSDALLFQFMVFYAIAN